MTGTPITWFEGVDVGVVVEVGVVAELGVAVAVACSIECCSCFTCCCFVCLFTVAVDALFGDLLRSLFVWR